MMDARREVEQISAELKIKEALNSKIALENWYEINPGKSFESLQGAKLPLGRPCKT